MALTIKAEIDSSAFVQFVFDNIDINLSRVTDTVMDTLRTLFREIVSQSFLFES